MVLGLNGKFSLIIFLVTAFATSFTLDLILSALNINGGDLTQNIIHALTYYLWGFARMYSVFLAAIVTMMVSGESVVKTIKNYLAISQRSIIFFLIAPFLTYLALGIYTLITMSAGVFNTSGLIGLYRLEAIPIPAETLLMVTLASGYIAAISINSLAALGEEVGWRGYLLNLLKDRLGIWRAFLLIGMIWGLWHASAILLIGYNFTCRCIEGVAVYMLFTTSLGVVLALLTHMAKSILPAVSLHGSVNAIWGVTPLITSTHEIFGGVGILGASAWALTALPLAILYRRKTTI